MAKKKTGVPQNVMRNAVRTLMSNIMFADVDNPVKTLVITSSIPNEGKSTVALNLAEAFAASGKRTLIVEADMRRRALADLAGVHAPAGLYAVLSGRVAVENAITPTQTKRLDVLDCEPHIPNPPDILSSKRFSHLLARLEKAYDIIIFDTPPVGTFVDAAILSRLVDGTIVVVRDNFTRRDDLVSAMDQLNKAEANILGTVLNDTEVENSSYYYSYYIKNGKRKRKRSDEAPGPSADFSDYDPAANDTPLPARRGSHFNN